MENKIIYVVLPGQRMAGLMSYYTQVVSNLFLVDNTHNKLYVNFKKHMLYKDFNVQQPNVWEYYFKQPFEFNKEEIESSTIMKNIWHEGSLNIPCRLDVTTRELSNAIIKKYIKLNDEINIKINDFFKVNFLEKKILGVHRRGTDHIKDAPELCVEAFFKQIDNIMCDYDKIFLATDEEQSVNSFRDRYEDKLITYPSIRSPMGSREGTHYSVGLKQPYKMGEDVVVETYLLSRCDFLIKTVSNVSNVALMINKDIEYLEIDKHIAYI
jgi:hypothetical protein